MSTEKNPLVVTLPKVRLAFPALFEPKTVGDDGGEAAYGAALIIDPTDTKTIKAIEEAMVLAAKGKWHDKATAVMATLRKIDKLALHDGDTKAQYDGFAGNLFISARSKTRPVVLDSDNSPLTASDGKVYGGCYVTAKVAFWAQDNKFGKRINAQLGGVRFKADGDSFGGGVRITADDFDDLGSEDEAMY